MAKSDRTKTERTNTRTHPTDTSGLRTDGVQAQKLDGLRRTGHAACEWGPIMTKQNQNVQFRHSRMMRWRKVLSVLSAIVVSVTTYALILPAITDSVKTWCGFEEHIHDDSCYELQLICGCEEGASETVVVDAGHRHTEDCYAEQKVLICGEEEHQPGDDETKAAGHIHTDACYEMQRGLVCGQEERDPVVEALSPHVHTEECYRKVLCCTKPEHRHEELCYSNPDAIETPEEWELKMPLDARSGVWADDLLLIADSQLGFRESEENFTLIDGERRGYTRFGDWYGDRYGDWGAMFVSFCLSYADIPETIVPYASDPACWAEALQEQALYRTRLADEDGTPAPEYAPQKGDLVFFKDAEDENGTPVRVGIVREVAQKEEETLLWTVEGDADHQVANRAYALDAAEIVGFAALPERPEWLAASFLHEDEGTQTAADEQTETVPGETLPGEENETEPGETAETSETAESETAAPTEPVLESDKNPAALSAKNVGETFLRIEKNTLVFEGGDYVITVRYGEESGIPEASALKVKELAPDSKRYAKHEEEASEQLAEDEELTFARFFDIKIIDAEGSELLLSDVPGVTVEIQLLDKPLLEEGGSVSVVHFADEGAERIDPEQTVLSEDDELEAVRFRAGGFSVWGVVQARPMQPRTLTAEAEGVHFLLDAPSEARIPEGATLEAVELPPDSEEYEDCCMQALMLLEKKDRDAEIAFARFFDLTIRDKNGRKLEPSSAVNVRFSYDEQLELSLGQKMYVVHFGDEGAELIETDLSRPVDANGAELTGTQVDFKQGSFSITGTVLTGDQLVSGSGDYGGIYNGFPKTAAEYYVTFEATVNGETKTFAMGYGGVVEEVTYDSATNLIHIGDDKLVVSDEWLRSFSWYYTNVAYIYNDCFVYPPADFPGDTQKVDYFGNFLSNDTPFAKDKEPEGGYRGGIQTLEINEKGFNECEYGGHIYSDYRNRIKYDIKSGAEGGDGQQYWDHDNYSFSGTPNADTIYTAKYAPMGGWSTFVRKKKVYTKDDGTEGLIYTCIPTLNHLAQDLTVHQTNYRPARSIYINTYSDGSNDIRLAMITEEKLLVNADETKKWMAPFQSPKLTSSTSISLTNITAAVLDKNRENWYYAFPTYNSDGTVNSVKTLYAIGDAVLALNRDVVGEGYSDWYWCWINSYQFLDGSFPNAIKATNLRFSTGYTTDGVKPAKPLASVEGYSIDAPEISKTLLPNNGGDGTYSLALSVMGDSHAARSNVVADVLVVADLSNSMLETDGGTETRLDVLKGALEKLKTTLLSQNTDGHTVVNMNLMTFGSWARQFNTSSLGTSSNANLYKYSYDNSRDWKTVIPSVNPWVSTETDFQDYITAEIKPVVYYNLSKPLDQLTAEEKAANEKTTLYGATNWEDALEQAYAILKARREAVAGDGAQHAQYLIFLTDGDPTCWMGPQENEPPTESGWLWDDDALFSSRHYYGNGNTAPMNIWYSLQEARDDAREIVWGLDTPVGDEGIADALTNTHVDPITGETEEPTTYLYAIATLGHADTLTNLLAYAYNGSFEATYPEGTYIRADNEAQLKAAFDSIASTISSAAAYTDVTIYDPITAFTHVATEMDNSTAFHYYRYRTDWESNVYDPSQNPEASGVTPRFQAVKDSSGAVTHYLDTQNSNAVVTNIYEVLSEWNRQVTVNTYMAPGETTNTAVKTVKPAEFEVKIYNRALGTEASLRDVCNAFAAANSITIPSDIAAKDDNAVKNYLLDCHRKEFLPWLQQNISTDPDESKPYYYRQEITWDIRTTETYQDVSNQTTDRVLLDGGYTYAVLVTVWPSQVLYDTVAEIENGQTVNVDSDYFSRDGSSYSYKTNLSEGGQSLATVSYRRYDQTFNSSSNAYQITVGSPGTQCYINPEPIPLTKTEISVQKTWEDSLDGTVLEKKIEDAVNAALASMGKSDLSGLNVSTLTEAERETLRQAYGVKIIPLVKSLYESFPSDDANVYDPAVEGRWALYREGTSDASLPGYVANSTTYPVTGSYEGSVPWAMSFYPGWHFYGEQPGENDATHKGHIVVDDRTPAAQAINVGVGMMISEANFNPLNWINNDYTLWTMKLIPSNMTEAEYDALADKSGLAQPHGKFFIIEEGCDYSFREETDDASFSLNTEIFHPMLIDGTLYDIEIVDRVVESSPNTNEQIGHYVAHVKSAGASTFTVVNRLRPQLTLSKETVKENAAHTAYAAYNLQNALGAEQTETVTFRGKSSTSLTYTLRPRETFTIRTEITVNPGVTPMLQGKAANVYYVCYPAYLDQMVTLGKITQAELDDYLMFELPNSNKHPLTAEYTEISERSFCTKLSADITLNANEHVRIYNVPEGAAVSMYEINNPGAWELCLCEWINANNTHDLYGSATAVTKLGKSGTPTPLTAYSAESATGKGFSHAAPDINTRESASFYNCIIPVDLELKKIDSMTASRATVTLTDSTTPAGSGTAYDDTAIPGLAGAQFTLYRRLSDSEEVAPADMETNGVLWLKPDGTTVSRGDWPTGAVQVVPARNYNGDLIAPGRTVTNGKHCFENLSLGTYCLVETVRPEGYDAPSIPEGSVGYLTVTVGTGETTFTQPDANGGASQTAIFRVEDGPPARAVYEIVITNTSGGTELPRTGGVGRELPTVLGAVLILIGAIALLIKKSRAKGGRTTA